MPLVGGNGASALLGEKPYAFTQCNYRTAQSDTLTRHMKKHTTKKMKILSFPSLFFCFILIAHLKVTIITIF